MAIRYLLYRTYGWRPVAFRHLRHQRFPVAKIIKMPKPGEAHESAPKEDASEVEARWLPLADLALQLARARKEQAEIKARIQRQLKHRDAYEPPADRRKSR